MRRLAAEIPDIFDSDVFPAGDSFTGSTAALMLPFGTVLAYSAYDPSALDWLQAGDYRLSFLIIGIGAMAYALIGLKDNWPK